MLFKPAQIVVQMLVALKRVTTLADQREPECHKRVAVGRSHDEMYISGVIFGS